MSHKSLKIGFFALLGLGLAVSQLHSAITINIGAEKLKDPGGFAMATKGIVVLVADTAGNGFSGAGDATLVQDDDFMVDIWDIETGGGDTPGAFSGTTGSISLSGDWKAGDPLALYFFPTLTAADPIESTASAAAIPYGIFRITSGNPDNTDDWVTPEDGTLAHDLFIITTDATVLKADGGSTDAEAGIASNVTPGTVPAKPTNVAGELDGGMITVTWDDNATDETGYRVERSVSGSGNWVIVDTYDADVSMITDTTAEAGNTYKYRVVAVRGSSFSEYSDESADVEATPALARLLNLSNRAFVGVNEERLIGSAITTGDPGTTVEVLVLVRGPSLPLQGVGLLADPTITFVEVGNPNATPIVNDNFADFNNGEIETRYPGFITNANEPGFFAVLEAGKSYSAVVEGVGQTEGVAQIEFYEVEGSSTGARLLNLSNRAFVGVNEERLIGSAITTGDPGTTVEVLVLVRGPSLPLQGVGLLADPMITFVEVGNPNATPIVNDNFADFNNGEIETRFPGFITNADEPGFFAVLEAGKSYSAVVEGVGQTEGVAQIEFYEVVAP